VAGEATHPALGALAALASALAWTLITLLARALSPHFSTFSLNIVRSAVGGVFLVAIALVAGNLSSLGHVSAGAWAFLISSVVLAVGVGDTAFFESARALGLARAMTFSTSYPLVASALAVWLFDERITLLDAAGTVVILAGLVLIVTERFSAGGAGRGEPGAGRRGLGLSLVTVLAWGSAATLMKPLLHEIDPLTIQAARLPLTALILWLTPWARGTARTAWARREVVGLPVLGLGALTAVSSITFMVGLKHAGVTLGTVLSATSPLFALPIGFLAFGERVTWRAVVGAVLCVAGLGLVSL
jgi:drug/metabolite transporter (DMT)-like permease